MFFIPEAFLYQIHCRNICYKSPERLISPRLRGIVQRLTSCLTVSTCCILFNTHVRPAARLPAEVIRRLRELRHVTPSGYTFRMSTLVVAHWPFNRKHGGDFSIFITAVEISCGFSPRRDERVARQMCVHGRLTPQIMRRPPAYRPGCAVDV